MKTNKTDISTMTLSKNWTITWLNGSPYELVCKCDELNEVKYSFDSLDVTPEIFESALRDIVVTEFATFEILYVLLADFERFDVLRDVMAKLFKEHFNNLYNSVIADDVLGRKKNLSNIDEIYDFFEEAK